MLVRRGVSPCATPKLYPPIAAAPAPSGDPTSVVTPKLYPPSEAALVQGGVSHLHGLATPKLYPPSAAVPEPSGDNCVGKKRKRLDMERVEDAGDPLEQLAQLGKVWQSIWSTEYLANYYWNRQTGAVTWTRPDRKHMIRDLSGLRGAGATHA